MPLITACPECHTQFVVKKEQLKAYEGQVRCGTCLHVFNAKTYLIKSARPKKVTVTQVDAVLSDIDLEQDAPLDSAITVMDQDNALARDAAVEAALMDNAPSDEMFNDANIETETLVDNDNLLAQIDPALPETSAFNTETTDLADAAETALTESTLATSADATPTNTETSLDAETHSAIVANEEDSVASDAAAASEHSELITASQADAISTPDPFTQHLKKRQLSWPLVALCVLLVLVLLTQLAYFMRTEISAHIPQTKPWLSAACAKLGCSVALPKNIDYLTIDDSDMHEHLERKEVLVFTSTLINHAAYAQAYPIIELTLTNTNDEPVLRRTLTAKDYLTTQVDVAQGIPANSDISIKLNLNTADIAVSGYRVSLSY